MSSLLRNCGLAALVLSATCLSLTEAQAGGRRNACNCQSYYGPPAATTYAAPAVVTNDGHQRYQSAYQAPAAPVYAAPANNYYYYSTGNYPLRFQDRSFHDQWDAGRKIRGY